MEWFLYFIKLHKNLTTKCSRKAFNLACQWSKDEISGCKRAAGSEGANTGHKKVCHGQVHKDVVEVGPELLVLHGACNGEDVNASANHKYKKHESCHGVEGAQSPQVVLRNQERTQGRDVVGVQRDGYPEVFRQLHVPICPHLAAFI